MRVKLNNLLSALIVTVVCIANITPKATQAATINICASTTWTAAGIAAGDNVVVGGGATLTINTAAAVCASIQLGRGALGCGLLATQGTLAFNAGSKLTVNGVVTLGGALLLAGRGNLNMTNGYLACRGFNIVSEGTYTVGGTVELTANNTLPVAGSALKTFNNLIINGGTTSLGQAMVVNNDLTFTSGFLDVTALNYQVSIAGNWTNNASATSFTRRSGTVVFNGSTIVDGTFDTDYTNVSISGALVGRPGRIIGVYGNWTNNGTFTHGAGTVNFKGTTLMLGSVTSTTFNHIITSGTLTAGSGVTSIINVEGDFTTTGTYVANTGTVIFNGTGAQGLNGTSNPNFYKMTVNKAAGTLTQNNATVTVLTLGTFTMQAGIFDCLTNTFQGIAGSFVTATGGTWKMAKLGVTLPEFPTTANYSITGGRITMYGAGNQNILSLNTSGSAQYYELEIAGSGTKTLLGDIIVAASLYLTSGTLDVSGSNYNIRMTGTGTFQNDATFTQRAGIVKFDGTNTVTGASTTTFYDLTIKSAGATGDLTGHSSNMIIQHDWTNNGTYTHNSGKVTFNGTAFTTGHVLGTQVTDFYNVDVGTNNYTLVAHPTEMRIAGDFLISTATFNSNYPTAGFGGDGMLTFNGTTIITSAAVLELNHVKISGTVTFPAANTTRVFGDWDNNGTFNHNNQLVNFRSQTVPGGSDAAPTGTARAQVIKGTTTTTFYDVSYNNPGAGSTLTMQQNVTVADQLDLAAGALMLNRKTLTIQNGVANTSALNAGGIVRKGAFTGTLGSGLGYMVSEDGIALCGVNACNISYVIWQIGANTGVHVYPFGNSAGVYIPFTYNLTAGNVGNLKIASYATLADDNLPFPVGVEHVHDTTTAAADNSDYTVDRFWHVESSTTTGVGDITFSYANAEIPVMGETGADAMGLVAQQWTGANVMGWAFDNDPTAGVSWITYYRDQTPNAGANTVTVNAFSAPLTSTMPWTLALHAHPLPVQLLDFVVKLNSTSEALVNWKTAQEVNNAYFEVERSTDGVSFTSIQRTKGAGNSSVSNNYMATDEDPYEGVSYYRLKQVDYNGVFTYSSIVPLVNVSVFEGIKVFPNPTQGNTNVIFRSTKDVNVQLLVYNSVGALVLQKEYQVNIGENQLNLEHSALPAGNYQFIILSNDIEKPYQGKFVKN